MFFKTCIKIMTIFITKDDVFGSMDDHFMWAKFRQERKETDSKWHTLTI